MKKLLLISIALGYLPCALGMQGPSLRRTQSLPNLTQMNQLPPVIPPAPEMPKQVAAPKHGPAPEQPSFLQKHPIAITTAGIGTCALIAAGVLWKLSQKTREKVVYK